MGFQDNSGDIIFDVILTDEGRASLAAGDMTITHFKLGDDEINYALFDNTTGSAYQDLQILQTPVFEAFSNNTSNMSSLLVTYAVNDILYMPVLKLNQITNDDKSKMHAATQAFVVTVDNRTEGTGNFTDTNTHITETAGGEMIDGFLYGKNPSASGNLIRIDAGIDNTAALSGVPLVGEFMETEYDIQIDDRLGRLVSTTNDVLTATDVDDDNIALYTVDNSMVFFVFNNGLTDALTSTEVIRGSRSTILKFKIKARDQLAQSDFLFDKFGGTTTAYADKAGATPTCKFIDTLIKVTGQATGYSLEIPVRFIKRPA